MLISKLEDKRVLVYGAGREGLSAIKLIHNIFPEKQIALYDDRADLSKTEVSAVLVKELSFDYDVIIKSPGVSYYGEFFQNAIKQGITITSGTNIFLADILSHARRPKLIGITGTKGKSTTSSLVYHFLTALSKKVVLAGNIGVPLLDVFGKVYDHDYVVIEMSSFQAADLAYPLDVACLNNLHSEHLDWHLNTENYHRDKVNIFLLKKLGGDKFPGVAILNKLDTNSQNFAAQIKNITYFNVVDAMHVKEQDIYDGDKLIIHGENIKLLGEHNLSNLAGVATILKVCGEDLSIMNKTISSFNSLKHRLEPVCEKDGITFVDDSISTTPIAVISALKVFKDKPTTILIGGYERGQVFTEVVQVLASLEKVKVICMPDTGKRIYEALKEIAPERTFFAESMSTAVQKAKAITPQGGVVLLSPSAPSFNAYKNYEERGEDFKRNI
ncbi:MAG: UDP-N-acetylmuramoyl-L-alanine--D-glutamate ligase [Deltaproteobacteria bacterium]|jgi:UDP-N-acetylmuramoylalanine--D-glutamate ligase|nr:UDP-N-acetylmuramoyl-L-alanine--D-glutamate ligase [Deltaproteobacteria bacterium]